MMIPKRNSIETKDNRKSIRVVIPDDVKFADLELVWDGGNIHYNPETMKKVIKASQVDPGMLLDWSNLSTLLVAWHERAVKDGQPPDPVMVALMSEVMDEIGREQHWDSGHA